MSHNSIKVGARTPDSAGELSITLSDLSDVNITNIGAGEVLKYDQASAEWINATAPAGQPSYIWLGGNYSNDYTNSQAGSTGSITVGDKLYIYHNNEPVNTISGASITASGNWVESVTLPAGQYVVRAQTMVSFSSSGYLAYRVEDSSGNRITSDGVVGDSRGTTYGPSNSTAIGYVDLSQQATISLVVKAVSGAAGHAQQGTTPSEYGFMYIEALSSVIIRSV